MVDMANRADVYMGLLALELATSSSDCEGTVVASGPGGSGCEVENGGGVNEGGGEMG